MTIKSDPAYGLVERGLKLAGLATSLPTLLLICAGILIEDWQRRRSQKSRREVPWMET